ncbi:hypothetical protein FLONG3_4910 [Fusarium longipes]|uniref:Uncharacterized protein n=1 Tax=Fusarium longipes TaxID=694270 RepID=A0A395SY29_9HYPO|nr:hypothetical protein FLONG3_4910 [Fusarium longipes]
MDSHSSRRNSEQQSSNSGAKQSEAHTFLKKETEEQPRTRQKPKSPVCSWLWEILSILFALALLVATITIPARHNDKVLKKWPYDIGLNTVVAILSTFMRAAMMLVVAELVGQIGWQSLQKPRPVSDLDHFNNASRGIYGAIKLFWAVPPRLTSMIAAIVIILSPAIAPFSQQAVRTVPCTRQGQGSATLPVSHYLPSFESATGISANDLAGDDLVIESDMKATMVNGLVNPTAKDMAIEATCASGNCTFLEISKGVTHASAAMCSSCLDISEFIKLNTTTQRNLPRFNFTLPNKQWFEPLQGYHYASTATGDIDWVLSGDSSEFAELAKESVTNLTILSFSQRECKNATYGEEDCPEDRLTKDLEKVYRKGSLVAVACALYPCIKQYHAQVKEGKLEEKVISEKLLTTSNRTNFGWDNVQTPCLFNGKEYNFDNTSQKAEPSKEFSEKTINGKNYTIPYECIYDIAPQYSKTLREFMEGTIFNGMCTRVFAARTNVDCKDKWWLNPFHNASYEMLDTLMDDFTTAITNKFRTQTLYERREEDSVIGSVNETTVCTVFDWRWILLPAGLMAITVALLIHAVIQSYTKTALPIWKTSILPLLFYGPNISDDQTRETDLDELQRQAAKIKVEFKDEDGVRLGRIDTRATEA